MSRGLYGQNEGNESRSQANVFTDICLDNELVEGEWERPMVAAAKKGQLSEIARLREAMKAQAVKAGCSREDAQKRADSCMNRALRFLKV